MSQVRAPESAVGQLSPAENQRQQKLSVLIGRFRAGEAVTADLKALGLHRMIDLSGVAIWCREPKLENIEHHVILLREIKSQRPEHEGRFYFIENPDRLAEFIGNLVDITEKLARAELENRKNFSQDDTQARAFLQEALELKCWYSENGRLRPKLPEPESKDSMTFFNLFSFMDFFRLARAKTKLRNLVPVCSEHVDQAKEKVEALHNNYQRENLKPVLAYLHATIFYLAKALIIPPEKSQAMAEAELGDKLDGYSGAITWAGFLSLLLDLKKVLDKAIELCIRHKETVYLEPIYLCRSLVALLDRDNQPMEKFLDYFCRAVCVDSGNIVLSSPDMHKLRVEALKNFSIGFAKKFPPGASKDSKLTYACSQLILGNHENNLYSSTPFIERAVVSECAGEYMDAMIDYAVACWLMRNALDTAPKYSLESAMLKKMQMLLLKQQKPMRPDTASPAKAKAEEKPVAPSAVLRAEEQLAKKAAKALERQLQREEERAKKTENEKKRKEAEKEKERQDKRLKKVEKIKKQAEDKAKKLQEEKDKAKIAEEARKKKAQEEADRTAAEKEKIEKDSIKAEQTKPAKVTVKKKKKKAKNGSAEKAAAAKQAEADRIEAEKEQAEKDKVKAAEEIAQKDAIAKQAEAGLKAEQETKQESKVEVPFLQEFPLELFKPELSNGTILFLKQLSFELQQLSVKDETAPQLEIYGSFVLYYSMVALNLSPQRPPRDLDLFVRLHGFSLNVESQKTSVISLLNKLGFRVTELNAAKGYINFEKALPQGFDFRQPMKGVYPIELTVVFGRYTRSINPIYFTRARFLLDHQRGLVSFGCGDESQKQGYIGDLLQGCFRIDLAGILKPSLEISNVFSRVLKFSDEYGAFFTRDKETTEKLLTDVPTISAFFANRLGVNCRRFNANAERMKDSCYLEMADLISKNYFSRKDVKPIIIGFLAALIELLRLEDQVIGYSQEPERVMAASLIAENLQKQFCRDAYPQAQSKKKSVLALDFYEALTQALSKHFGLPHWRGSRVLQLPEIARQGQGDRAQLLLQPVGQPILVQRVTQAASPVARSTHFLVQQVFAPDRHFPLRENTGQHQAYGSRALSPLAPSAKGQGAGHPGFWSGQEAVKPKGSHVDLGSNRECPNGRVSSVSPKAH